MCAPRRHWRKLVGPRLSPEFLDGSEGIGWEGDLDEMRGHTVQDT
jgi:Arc/MetJ family transcription regulator